MEVGGQSHAQVVLPPAKGIGAHYIGGWVGPKDGLER